MTTKHPITTINNISPLSINQSNPLNWKEPRAKRKPGFYNNSKS